MKKGEYILPISTGLANALRRTIIMDIEVWAPDTVTFEVNTSCQTDEYIAHRIGLIPFKKIGEGTEMKINVKGRTVFTSDLVGNSFEFVNDCEIIEMIENQELNATINFKLKKGSTHARYKLCSGVGIQILNNNMYKLVFETLDDKDPDEVMNIAISELNKKVDDALQQLGAITVS